MPAVSLQKSAAQVTFLMPPGRPFGTGSTTPPMKTSPVPPDDALTSQSLSVGSNEVDAEVAPGVRTMTPLGTATWYAVPPAVKSIDPFSTCSVTGAPLGRPLAVKALLNHTLSPAGTAVPLKLAAIDETVD